MTNMIETNQLTKRYKDHDAVHRVSLSVPKGSIYGFIGPNGAGKSTTMKLLLGLIKPSGGSIRLLGKEMNQKSRLDILRETGSLIEAPSCYGHLTGQENLEIVAELKGIPKSDIDRVLEVVQLTQYRRQKVKQYSLGMRQRLGIAQAMLGKPKLLILDEPTNGLDPAGIQEMRQLISNLPQSTGATVLISSHLLSELEHTVDHVGIINHGRLLFQGQLRELQKHSRGEIALRVLNQNKAAELLFKYGFQTAVEKDSIILPPMSDRELAKLVELLASSGAGVVGLTQKTKSLEDIFLSLTGEVE